MEANKRELAAIAASRAVPRVCKVVTSACGHCAAATPRRISATQICDVPGKLHSSATPPPAFATMVAPLRASAQRLGVRAAAAAATITTATITTATACAASAEPFGNARQFEAIKRFRSQLVRMPEMTTRFS